MGSLVGVRQEEQEQQGGWDYGSDWLVIMHEKEYDEKLV